jgi:hypothetical protein
MNYIATFQLLVEYENGPGWKDEFICAKTLDKLYKDLIEDYALDREIDDIRIYTFQEKIEKENIPGFKEAVEKRDRRLQEYKEKRKKEYEERRRQEYLKLKKEFEE